MDQNREPMPVSPDLSGTGYLIVQVTTARGAIPLEGARVDIRSFETTGGFGSLPQEEMITSLVTNRDGNTTRVALPAPPRSISEQPGNIRPYSVYHADVSLEGYYTQSYSGIPIFDGVTAIQSAVMIPLPENGTTEIPRPDSVRFFESSSGDL